MQIKNILAGMRSVETVGKITKKFELREFKTKNREGKVASLVLGDETGTIRIVLWGDQAENINKVNEGDILKVVGGYVRDNQNQLEVHLNDRSKFIINPEGETVGEVKETEPPKAQRKQIKEITEADQNIELLGTIVQAFEPKFFEVCPDCGKRTKQEGETFNCSVHGNITPDFSYVMNTILDDGTETIRCTFFRNQAEKLLDKTKEQMMVYKEDPSAFEPMKTELLGNIVKLVGRVNKNDMFNRLEFITQLVFTNTDPEEEIKKLEENKPEEKTDNSAQTRVSESDSLPQTPEEEIKTEVEKVN